MKSYDELTHRLLERRDEYLANRKAKKKKIIRIATPLCCLFLLTLLSVGVWQSGAFRTPPSMVNTASLTVISTSSQWVQQEGDVSSAPSNPTGEDVNSHVSSTPSSNESSTLSPVTSTPENSGSLSDTAEDSILQENSSSARPNGGSSNEKLESQESFEESEDGDITVGPNLETTPLPPTSGDAPPNNPPTENGDGSSNIESGGDNEQEFLPDEPPPTSGGEEGDNEDLTQSSSQKSVFYTISGFEQWITAPSTEGSQDSQKKALLALMQKGDSLVYYRPTMGGGDSGLRLKEIWVTDNGLKFVYSFIDSAYSNLQFTMWCYLDDSSQQEYSAAVIDWQNKEGNYGADYVNDHLVLYRDTLNGSTTFVWKQEGKCFIALLSGQNHSAKVMEVLPLVDVEKVTLKIK